MVLPTEACKHEHPPPLASLQMAARYGKGDTLALNTYLQKWADEEGWVLTDDFIKYYFYGESTRVGHAGITFARSRVLVLRLLTLTPVYVSHIGTEEHKN